MAVYVDAAKNPLGRMKMCHMTADNWEELHTMAKILGVSVKHFQYGRHGKLPHYDICKGKRTIAVKLGAKEVSTREIVIKARDLA